MTHQRFELLEYERNLLRCLADNSLNVRATFIEMHTTRKTVEHALLKIRKRTGLNPQNFWDLHELLEDM